MKEFALKHPILTFILADITFYNIFNVINNALKVRAMKHSMDTEEKVVSGNEPAGDIQ